MSIYPESTSQPQSSAWSNPCRSSSARSRWAAAGAEDEITATAIPRPLAVGQTTLHSLRWSPCPCPFLSQLVRGCRGSVCTWPQPLVWPAVNHSDRLGPLCPGSANVSAQTLYYSVGETWLTHCRPELLLWKVCFLLSLKLVYGGPAIDFVNLPPSHVRLHHPF